MVSSAETLGQISPMCGSSSLVSEGEEACPPHSLGEAGTLEEVAEVALSFK